MPSAAKSRRLREPFTFFIDRSLGARLVADAIRLGCEPEENLVEREAILAGHVAWFALARGDLTAGHMGQIFCAALSRIRTVLRRFEVPIIATVSMEAAVTVRYGDELRPPKAYASRPARRR